MKKITFTMILLLSLTMTISCKKEAKETIDKIETPEVTSTNTATDATSETTEENEATEITDAESTEEKVTETTEEIKSTTVSKTVNETKKEVVKEVQDIKTPIANKTTEVVAEKTEAVKETVETAKEEVTAVVKETKKEVVEEVVEPVKEVVKETPKQPTQAEKIARGKTLFTTGICKNCHHQTKKLIGPTLVNIGSIYKKKKGSIATFLKGNGKPIVEPKKFKMMKPNIDDVTRHMSTQDREALEAYILSFAK